jgi:hypothetical protein
MGGGNPPHIVKNVQQQLDDYEIDDYLLGV